MSPSIPTPSIPTPAIPTRVSRPSARKGLSFAALVAAAIALSAPLAAPARAQAAPDAVSAPAAAPAVISVTGQASVARAPDMATVSIGVTTQARSAAEALSDNSAAMAGVIARLRAAGVADAEIQTSGLSVSPNWTGYDSSSSGPSISGYTASNMVTVRITALDGLGSVLDAAVADGANTLGGVNFGLVDPAPALDEARKLAVADARAKAELFAQAAGVALGPIVSITEGGGGHGGPVPVFKAQDSAMAVPVEGGEVGFDASVTIVWQLVP
ncbi:SIMPL domain-containing protein [Pseudogemmobacter sonorensis]|uniref:SIMPL domain-containing protein n=1 Tax=Pseudogemmobacter sonorensis TaxID=2989681 RepID=UPI0036763E9C